MIPLEQGIIIQKDDSPRILERQPSYHDQKAQVIDELDGDNKDIAETSQPAIKTAKAPKKKKKDDGFRKTDDFKSFDFFNHLSFINWSIVFYWLR